MKLSWKVGLAGAGVAAAVSIGGVAIADATDGPVDTGTGANDAPAPAGYTGINDPSLHACMAARQQCNPQGEAELQAVPWSTPLPAGAAQLSRAQAQQFVLQAIGAPVTAQVFSELLTGSQAAQAFGVNRASNVDESRPVWVVTVIAPTTTDGGPAALPAVKPFYSALVDAGSGEITDDCTGCEWLTRSA